MKDIEQPKIFIQEQSDKMNNVYKRFLEMQSLPPCTTPGLEGLSGLKFSYVQEHLPSPEYLTDHRFADGHFDNANYPRKEYEVFSYRNIRKGLATIAKSIQEDIRLAQKQQQRDQE